MNCYICLIALIKCSVRTTWPSSTHRKHIWRLWTHLSRTNFQHTFSLHWACQVFLPMQIMLGSKSRFGFDNFKLVFNGLVPELWRILQELRIVYLSARMHDIIGCAALQGQIVSWHSQQISTQLLLALCDFLMSINGTTIFNIISLKMLMLKIHKAWGNRTFMFDSLKSCVFSYKCCRDLPHFATDNRVVRFQIDSQFGMFTSLWSLHYWV